MSEKIYAWLLHLYPSHFREAYGEEALQLFRDRARHEKGFFARLQLWLDLLADLAFSVPRQYLYYVRPTLIGASAQRCLDGTPCFHVMEGKLPHLGALLFGGLLSITVLGAFQVLMSYDARHQPPTESVAQSQGPTGASSSSSADPAPHAPPNANEDAGSDAAKRDTAQKDPVEATIQPASAATSARLGAMPSGLQSNSLLPVSHPGSPQQQTPQAKPQGAAGAMVDGAKIDAAERRRVIDGAVANVKKYYIDPDVAQKTADSLLAHEKNGDDDAVTEGEAFADLLTRQMKDVSHDPYLMVVYNQVSTSDEGPPDPTPEDRARYRKQMERIHCTFEKVKILPHNIGYLKLNAFPDLNACQPTAAAAMASLNNADAIIFDLRDNHGGNPRMVALLCTYLFDHPTHLNDFYYRGENSTEHLWTFPPVPGNKLADKPAYVLTSATSFSAAEGFSYDLKMLKRATIVGETTSGRGHMGIPHRIDDHFMVLVPGMKVTNPISKTNWEGKGVEPDVKVKAADALLTAEKLAKSKLHKR